MFTGKFDDDEQKLLVDGLTCILGVTERAAKAKSEPEFAPIYARKIARIKDLQIKLHTGGVK